MQIKNWQVISKKKTFRDINDLFRQILENRGLTSKKEINDFLDPPNPEEISIKDLGISKKEVIKAVKRIQNAKENGEQVVIYGDYDADGVCATAILWESLYSLKVKVMPYLPDRFSEGYGINVKSIDAIKKIYPKLGLIITVDNGIVANAPISHANKLGIDVIVTDHHEPALKKPKAFAIIHTKEISGSGVAWIFAREIYKFFKKKEVSNGLELAAIGTISDQLKLIGANRSIVKFGLIALNKTKRTGLISLIETSSIDPRKIGTYEVGFMIAPRINSMGRMSHPIDSLRLLCTNDKVKALNLAKTIEKTNLDRQRVVEEVLSHALKISISTQKTLVIANENYHEGVIGLAAAKLVEKYYLPSIVISKGERLSKASARSISGFNIIDNIRKLEHLIIEGGGHEMAAGFVIETKNIETFTKQFEEIANLVLSEDLLSKKLKIDAEIEFSLISWELIAALGELEPFGSGNVCPVFLTKQVKIIDCKKIGTGGKHLKLKVTKNNLNFDAVAFGFGDFYEKIVNKKILDLVYSIEVNVWNGRKTIQLKLRDIK